MITPAYVRTLAAYNAEMNRRIYAAAAQLPAEIRSADQGAFFGSVLATLNHLLWADQMWMSRFDGWAKPAGSGGDPENLNRFEDFDTLTAERIRADAGIVAWAERVTQDWLDGQLAWYSGLAKTERTAPTGYLVMHMFNHQTHHRGQVHALLTRSHLDPGVTDLWLVVPPG
jgi:uncharacterized damage-inducible protein DinB